MTVRIDREQDLVAEAIRILLAHMPPDKVARVIAAWQVGEGEYSQLRQQLFAGETVEALSAKIRDFEQKQGAQRAES
jgi:hypothetical protein